MKKKVIIISSLVIMLLISGCGMSNTPSKKVEEFLGRYQSMDSEVLTQLDSVVSSDGTMSDSQKKDYKSLMEKQYQNMSYKIKNETIDNDKATVDVEIEVYDYATNIAKSKEYYDSHKDEFSDTKETITEDDARVNDDTTNNTAGDNAKTNDTTTDNNTTDDNTKTNDTTTDNNTTDDNTKTNDTTTDNNTTDNTTTNESSKYIDYKIKELKDVTDKVKYTITFHLTKSNDQWILDDISDSDREKLHGLFEG